MKKNVHKKENPNRKIIANVGVDLSSPDIQKAKSIDDLKKLEIFSHLKEKDQEAAYEELFKAIEVAEEVEG